MRRRISGKGYRRLLRWAAVPITDRKWAAPLSAAALGFGLFIGVAIGPGTAGTMATGALEVIEVPGFADEPADDAIEARGGAAAPSGTAESKRESGPDAKFASGSSASPSFEPLPLTEPEDESAEAAPSSPNGDLPAAEAPPESERETLEGLVVHVNRAAGSYVVAEPGGAMTAVHASTAPRAGTRVEVPALPLANGTYGEAGRRIRSGSGKQATVSGIVTHVDGASTAPAYTVSSRGVSLLVRVRPDPNGAAPALPAVGAFANVVVEIAKREPSVEPAATEPPAAAPTCAASGEAAGPAPALSRFVVWQRRLEAEGTPLTYGNFAGVVLAVCPESGQMLLSADDVFESGGTLLFSLSDETVDLAPLSVGASILATATIGADGELSIMGVADDEHRRRADDTANLQGDLAEP